MAQKNDKTDDAQKTTKDGDAGEAEVQARVDAENEQGFVGDKVDPLPNEAYSQETDPTKSPGVLEAQASAAAALADNVEATRPGK